MTRLDPESYPVLMPHFGYHGDSVYFGAKRIAAVSRGEGWFLHRCDGTKTLVEAAEGCGLTADFLAGIAAWMIWWPEPLPPAATAAGPTKVERLVLAASPEDPWVGMGGTLLLDAATSSAQVLDCFQSFTGAHVLGYRTPRELAMACSDEAAVAARLAGVGHETLGIPEKAARRAESVPDLRVHEILRARIARVLEVADPRELWLPAGLGPSPDARLLHDAAMSLVAEGVGPSSVLLYPDAPSTNGERQVDELLARFENAFLAPVGRYRDVDRAAQKKGALLEVFQCRLSSARRRAWKKSAERDAALGGYGRSAAAERAWELTFVELE